MRIMSTDKLVRAGIALLGCGILVVNAFHMAPVLDSWPTLLANQLLVAIPGLIVGAALVAGIKMGGASDRRSAGMRVALAGAAFVLAEIASWAAPDSGSGRVDSFYALLLIGPVGAALGVPLLVIGLKIFAQERLVGLCMMIPGAGFLPFIPYLAIYAPVGADVAMDLRSFDMAFDAIYMYGAEAIGAAMAATGVAMIWRARRGTTARPRRVDRAAPGAS